MYNNFIQRSLYNPLKGKYFTILNINERKNLIKYFYHENISAGAALRQERSPRRGARRAGAINSLQFIKKNI